MYWDKINLWKREKNMRLWGIMFNAIFSNISVISWWSVALVEETGVPGENHRPDASHLQTLSHKCLSWAGFELTTLVVIGTDCIVSCKSYYHQLEIKETTETSCLISWHLPYIRHQLSTFDQTLWQKRLL
jgi:hypothetical protein